MQKKLLKGNIIEFIVDVNIKKECTDLLRIIKKLGRVNSHKILITTDLPLHDFHEKIGQAVATSTQFKMELPKGVGFDDTDTMYNMMGRMILDEYISKTYYIRSDADKKVYEIKGEM